MDDLPENTQEGVQAREEGVQAREEADPRAPFLHAAAQVRDRAKLAIRQHDLPALGHAVHDLADLVHRMIRGPVDGN